MLRIVTRRIASPLVRSVHSEAGSTKPVKKAPAASKAPRKTPVRTRSASTVAPAKPVTEPQVVTVAHTVESTASPTISPEAIPVTESPGIPPASEPTVELPTIFVNTFNLPDISEAANPLAEDPVQIPFFPDSWDSSKVPSVGDVIDSKPVPKLLVVDGGASTTTPTPAHNHDTNVQPPTEQSSTSDHSRPLNEEEARGAWLLIGALIGTFVVGRATAGPAKEKKAA